MQSLSPEATTVVVSCALSTPRFLFFGVEFLALAPL